MRYYRRCKALTKINQSSIRVFCLRAGLSLQTQHFPLYPLLSLPFRIFIQSIYHNVVYHHIFFCLELSSHLPFLLEHPLSRHFLLSQCPSQFLFLFHISSSIILPSPTLSSTTDYFSERKLMKERTKKQQGTVVVWGQGYLSAYIVQYYKRKPYKWYSFTWKIEKKS